MTSSRPRSCWSTRRTPSRTIARQNTSGPASARNVEPSDRPVTSTARRSREVTAHVRLDQRTKADVEVRLEPGVLVIELEQDTDLSLERQRVRERAMFFERVFGTRVELRPWKDSRPA